MSKNEPLAAKKSDSEIFCSRKPITEPAARAHCIIRQFKLGADLSCGHYQGLLCGLSSHSRACRAGLLPADSVEKLFAASANFQKAENCSPLIKIC